MVHSVLLTVHCQRGQEISENLFTDMENRKSIEDLLRDVDEEFLIYAGELRSNGFTQQRAQLFHTATGNYTAQNQNQTSGFKRTSQDQDNGNNTVNDVFRC